MLPSALVALVLAAGGPPATAASPATSTATPTATPSPSPAARPPPGEAPALTRRYAIERIELNGLAHTRADEVRRHLLVQEGELLDDQRVLLSRLRLLQLGWFSRVETRLERGSERGQVVLVFDLTERNTLIITDFVLGTTPAQPIYGGLGLSQQNFLGRGLGLSGAFVYGGTPAGRRSDPSRYTLRGGFFAPDLTVAGLPPLVFGASGLYLRGEELACGDPGCDAFSGRLGSAPRLRYERAGGELTVGFRPGPFERISMSYRLEHLHGQGLGAALDPTGAAAAPPIRAGDSTLAILSGTYEIDTRDDFFFPTEGVRGVVQVGLASRIVGGDYEYSRYLLQLETGFGLLGQRLRFQGTLGAVQGEAPFFDRFYAADYSYFAVGPALGRALELNFSTDSRYDAFLAMGGLEYAVPLWARGDRFFQRGYLAVGARGVWSSRTLGGSRTGFSKVPLSCDVALRLDTPVGTFDVSLAYALDNAL